MHEGVPPRWNRCRRRLRVGASLLSLLLFLSLLPAGGRAQSVASACAAGAEELVAPCRDLALAAEAIRGGAGLLSGHGTPLPGGVSTIGRRLQAAPRIAMAARITSTAVRVPDLRDVPGATGARSAVVPSTQLSAAVGALDGFALAPTVGGVLSVDLLGSANVVHLSSSRGFTGAALTYGAGARLGLLRESFTLPGVSVSALHHRGTEIRYGAVLEDGREVRLSPSVTSVRAMVGKDFLALGLSAGVGWDRYGGSVETRVLAPEEREVVRSVAPPADDRTFLFAAGTYTLLVLQLTGELGWAPGLGEAPGPGQAFDPSRGSVFGSAAVRLTY